MTPCEAVLQHKPNLANFKIWGCPGVAHIPKQLRTCLDQKARECMFMGYYSEEKGYLLYDPAKKQIFYSHDVKFEEALLEKKTTFPALSPPPPRRVHFEDEDDEDDGETGEADAPPPPPAEEEDEQEPPPAEAAEEEHGPAPQEDAQEIYPQQPTHSHALRDRTKLKSPARLQYYALNTTLTEEPKSLKEALDSPQKKEWMAAMNEEFLSLLRNKTFKIVKKPEGVRPLDAKWVYAIKRHPDNSIDRLKARLCARGYKQRYGIDFNETFASVARYESVRIMIAVAIAKGLHIQAFDVQSAFLNAYLEEKVYMHQPHPFHNGNDDEVWLILRALYGLRQSSHEWKKRLEEVLLKLGFVPITSDSSVYISKKLSAIVFLVDYVDDGLIISSSKEVINQVLDHLRTAFQITTPPLNQFLGMCITQDKAAGTLILHSGKSIQVLLEKFNMAQSRPATVPMALNLQLEIAEKCDLTLPYRELIGSLLFLARTTRPDIAVAVNRLSQFCCGYAEPHWQAAKDILRYLSGTIHLGLEFQPCEEITVQGYCDSDYATDKITRKSITGFVFLMNNTPISWLSQKQPIVAVSSTEAEFIALATAAKEAIWLRSFLQELGINSSHPMDLFVDNTSAIKLAHHQDFHQRSKHIDVRYHFVRNLVQNEVIQVSYIPTNDQKADGFTKPLQKNKHFEMREQLSLQNVSPSPTKEGHAKQGKALQLKTKEEPEVSEKGRKFINTKSRCLSPNAYCTALMMMTCVICPAVNGIILKNAEPTLWRKTDMPVTIGNERVHLRIKLINPCSLLTSEILHTDITRIAQIKCEEIYKTHFIKELAEMCPVDYGVTTHHAAHSISKRFITVIGILIIAAVVVVGSAVALGLSIANRVSIEGLKSTQAQQAELIEQLEGRLNITNIAVRKLQTDFNTMVDEFEKHTEDFDELKMKQTSTNFAISFITSRMVLAKQIIIEARRQWKQKKVHAGLMDYFNLTLPCGDDCPLNLAKSRNCRFHENLQDLYMEFDVPRIDRNLQLLEVDQFKLMMRKENQTCSLIWTGPTHIIVNGKDGCVNSVNLKNQARHDLILSPDSGCEKPLTDNENQHFGIGRCELTQEGDERNFIQVKPYHGMNYIYYRYHRLPLMEE